MCDEERRKQGDLVFLASPSSQQSADILSTRTRTSGTLSFGNNSVFVAQQKIAMRHPRQGGIKGVWVKEAAEGLLPDISALKSTCWVGPPGHLEVMPEWWPCRMEPVARRSCS